MSELKKVSVCPFCGSQLSSEHRNEYELAKQNAKLRSLLARMSEVGDELAHYAMNREVDDLDNTLEYFCGYCYSETYKFSKDEKTIPHSPDCPVTRWEDIKKEMEG